MKDRALLEIILTAYGYLEALQPQYCHPISLVRVIPTLNVFLRYFLFTAYAGRRNHASFERYEESMEPYERGRLLAGM